MNENLTKEDIRSIFDAIPLEILLKMRDSFTSWRTSKSHGRFEVSVKDGYASTWHETNSGHISRQKRA